MASIATSIEIYDRVSKPVTSMIRALDNMCNAFESVENSMGNGFNTSKITQARAEIAKAAEDVVQLGNRTEENENHQEDYNKSVRSGTLSMDGLVGKVAGLVATYASLQTITKSMDLSDEFTQTEARLNMMNDGMQTTDELQQMVYQSAQRSRGAYQSTADAVSKLGLNAGDAFDSTAEIVAFAEQLNKQFVIAGTESSAMEGAMTQLVQALGAGALRGDELNSIFEAAPTIIQTIADYMGKPIGEIRGMAQEGQITADIVKNAMLSATDETNAKFSQMPMTWGQVWTIMKNNALMTFQPILQRINSIANSPGFQTFATNAVNSLATIANVLLSIISLVVNVANFFVQNWSWISPIVMGIVTALGLYYGAMLLTNMINGISATMEATKAAAQAMSTGATFAATAAQYGFNAALYACPLTWILIIIIAVIAAIYAIIGAINKVTGKTTSATGVILGAIMTAVAAIWNIFLGLLDLVLGIISAFQNAFAGFANFFGNVFTDPIGSIIHLFGDMADYVLGVVETIASALDKVFGSNMAETVAGWRGSLDAKVEAAASQYGNGKYEEKVAKTKLTSESLGLKRWAYKDAYNKGYGWGEGFDSKVSGVFGGNTTDQISNMFDSNQYGKGYNAGNIPANIAGIKEDTGDVKDSVEISSEDLKYLRDIAEKEVVNRFTTAEIKVDMTNNNNISSEMDLDGIVNHLVVGVNEAMDKVAEGVHD